MNRSRIADIAAAAIFIASLSGCSSDKKEARATLTKIDELCQAGKPDEAREHIAKTADKNDEFRRAFSFATSGLTDRANINPCGQVLTEMKTQLAE
jgi:hypothetical protein